MAHYCHQLLICGIGWTFQQKCVLQNRKNRKNRKNIKTSLHNASSVQKPHRVLLTLVKIEGKDIMLQCYVRHIFYRLLKIVHQSNMLSDMRHKSKKCCSCSGSGMLPKKGVVSSFPFFGLQGPEGDRTVAMALADPEKFVLKPQREGGGKVTSAYHQKKLAHDVSWYSLRCSLRCPFGGIPTGIIAKKNNTTHDLTYCICIL